MSIERVLPSAIIEETVTASTSNATLRDGDTDTSFIMEGGEYIKCSFDDASLPSGSAIRFAIGVPTASFFLTPSLLVGILNLGPGKENSSSVNITSVDPRGLFLCSVGINMATSIPDGLEDADVDAMTFQLIAWGGNEVEMHEVAVIVGYWVRPTLSVVALGTMEEDNSPTIEWNSVFDGDVEGTLYYQVKIFGEDQFTTVGFDPDDTDFTAVDQSGILSTTVKIGAGPGEKTASIQSWHLNLPLSNGTYRAYVQVADVPSHSSTPEDLQWSEWEFDEFEIDVPRPADPEITLQGDGDNGRIRIEIEDGDSGEIETTYYEIERSYDGGETWEHVRTELGDGLIDA